MNDAFDDDDPTPASVGCVLSVETDPFPSGPRCVFCGELVDAHIDSKRGWSAHTQAIGTLEKRRPGKTIYWHTVCREVP